MFHKVFVTVWILAFASVVGCVSAERAAQKDVMEFGEIRTDSFADDSDVNWAVKNGIPFGKSLYKSDISK